MYLIESNLKADIKKVHYLKKANVYVFENYLVIDFGYISNRIHKYTVNIADFIKNNSLFQKKYPTAIVIYDDVGLSQYKFEKQLSNCKAIICKSLKEAVTALSPFLTKAC